MYEYRIIRNDMGWIIYRKKEMGKLMLLQYLNSHGLRTPNKQLAKTFYHKEDALSALVIAKSKGDTTDTTLTRKSESEDIEEKK